MTLKNRQSFFVPIFCLFFSLFFGKTLYGQQAKIDSLEQLLPRSHDSIKVDLLNAIASDYSYINPKLSVAFAEKSTALARKIQDTKKEAFSLNRLGVGQWSKGDFDPAMRSFNASINLAEKLKDKNLIARNIGNISLIYTSMGYADIAITYDQKALALFKRLNDQERILVTLNNIGRSHLRQANYDSAEYYLQKSALDYAKYRPNTADIHINIGNLRMLQKRYTEAIAYLEKGLATAQQFDDKKRESRANYLLAVIYLEQKQIVVAKKYAQRAITIAETIHSKEELHHAYEVLSKVLFAEKDYVNAYRYEELFALYKDSLQNQNAQNALHIFDYERKKVELNLLKATQMQHKAEYENEKIKFKSIIASGIISLLFLTTIIIFIFNSNKKLKNKNNQIALQAKQLAATNQTKDKLFSIIGHDLRSPIGYLLSTMELITYKDITIDEFQKLLPNLEESVKSLYETLDNLLIWSYSQLQGFKLSLQNTNLAFILDFTITTFSGIGRKKGITINQLINSDISVFVDENQARVVFRNLLNNALKFTDTNGTITFSATVLGDFVEVSITDTGVGMSAEQLETLFQDKEHRSKVGTAGEKGIGLGLMLCKEMVEGNGGYLRVVSELGKGSTFIVGLKKALAD